jgi:hypothetical protein
MSYPTTRPSRLLCVAVLLAVVASLPRTVSGEGGPAAGAPVVPANVGALLQELRAANPEDVERDSAGNVVSVALRQGWASDHNLTLLSTVDTLHRLVLVPSRRVELTEHGLTSLARLTNLVSLYLNCSGALRADVFRAACGLKRLRCLGLYGACPPVGEYNSITNLQDLAELHVAYCTNFTDQQLALVTNLPNLRTIELKADGLSGQATNIASRMRTLTNIVIKPSRL